MKVLIVEDSRLLRLANERALSKAGYQVMSAQDGEEGLRLADEFGPDLIVLDMMLPRMPGQEVLRELRQREKTRGIPVMVLTSLPQRNEEKLLRDGATAYFEKNMLSLEKNSERFVDAVGHILGRRERARAASAPH